ncbi:MAG: aromatic ring-hydroxylating dioxygenase subunit alpha [Porticoccaceae bacterium]
MQISKDRLKEKISEWAVVDDTEDYRLDRAIYTDPDLFEFELRHIFENNWVYVAHESQVRNRNDFITTWVGRQPVIVTRDNTGVLRCMLNVCSHRGAVVCRSKAGNKRNHMCRFHGWVYSSRGDLIGVTTEERGAYPDSFSREKLGMPQLRVESYRGFIFASINPGVQPLDEYLGEAYKLIDLVLDQTPDAKWEVVRGTTMYTYPGNWKLSAENGLDGYHAGSVHASYVQQTMRRMKGESALDTKALDLSGIDRYKGGFQAFENGHGVIWSEYPNQTDRPTFQYRDYLLEKHGAAKTNWMLASIRNLLLAPNVYLMDSACTQLRIVRPISVDKTEVTTYCFAPEGEEPAAREKRLRQYEDFYNASGLATPDDLAEFTYCQMGFGGRAARWSDISRGGRAFEEGAGKMGAEIGFNAVLSGENEPGNEGIYVAMYRDWRKRLLSALEKEIN